MDMALEFCSADVRCDKEFAGTFARKEGRDYFTSSFAMEKAFFSNLTCLDG
jgi:hypothetical protein